MKLLYSNTFLLLCIIIVASILRFYNLSTIPISLNPDELAIGYNSYSLLTTGKDEWGKVFPLALKSFGDWKLPVYPIITMLPIRLFDLSEFSVRLPSALAGSVSIWLIYLVTTRLFKQRKIAIISAFFLAISPWSIFFSRGAFEPNLALTFLLAGVYFFLRFLDNKSSRYLFYTSILFGITLFTYAGYDVFMPIFYSAILLYYRREVFTHKMSIVSVSVFIIFFFILVFSVLASGGTSKLSALSVFNDPNVIYNRGDKFRGDSSRDSVIVDKILFNKSFSGVYQFGENYLLSFSPTFLFDRGGVKVFYNISGFGFLYLFDAVLLFIGMVSLFWEREKAIRFLLIWFILAPIPLAITNEVPAPTRVMDILPVFILVQAYGAFTIAKYILAKRNLVYYCVGISAVVAFFLNVCLFLDLYYIHMNVQDAGFFHYGYKQADQIADRYPNDKVVMVGPENFSYISFLFYEKYDPHLFRQQVTYYPQPYLNFNLVKSFGRYTFVRSIDRHNLSPKTLYIDYPNKFDKTHLIRLPNGDPVFTYFEEKDLQENK